MLAAQACNHFSLLTCLPACACACRYPYRRRRVSIFASCGPPTSSTHAKPIGCPRSSILVCGGLTSARTPATRSKHFESVRKGLGTLSSHTSTPWITLTVSTSGFALGSASARVRQWGQGGRRAQHFLSPTARRCVRSWSSCRVCGCTHTSNAYTHTAPLSPPSLLHC
jgi:hypothetical protein